MLFLYGLDLDLFYCQLPKSLEYIRPFAIRTAETCNECNICFCLALPDIKYLMIKCSVMKALFTFRLLFSRRLRPLHGKLHQRELAGLGERVQEPFHQPHPKRPVRRLHDGRRAHHEETGAHSLRDAGRMRPSKLVLLTSLFFFLSFFLSLASVQQLNYNGLKEKNPQLFQGLTNK